MSPKDRAPTRDELLAMAYVDGELEAGARREFEDRLGHENALLAEVAQLKELNLLARQLAPPEPMDHEWRRLDADWVHRGGRTGGLWLLGAGAMGLAACVLVWLFTSPLHLAAKACAGAVVVGLLLLFLTTLRARLRTLPYDPYTKVKR